jgi:imidazolonepropionase-like amidohydrolase
MKKLILLILVFTSIQSFGQKTYLQCGHLIDVNSGKTLAQMTIVTDGSKITDVLSGYKNGSLSDKIIDLKNKTVLPGLIDCHVHLEHETSKDNFREDMTSNKADVAFRSTVFAKKTLMAGFTTVRDCGGSGVNIALRNAIDKGEVIGPHILTAGVAISATGGHMDPTHGLSEDLFPEPPQPKDGVADGKDELIKAVRLQFKKGADLIKIASTGGVLDLSKDGSGAQYSIEEIRTVVETAKDYGMKVACHAHGAEGIKRAIIGGVASIEHGTFMDAEGMELAKKNGTYLVPTIIAGKSVADSAKIPNYYPPVIAKKASEIGPLIQGTFAKAYKAGVKIAFGTDAGVYAHGKNAKEFVYMTEAGMPPMEAIQSATKSAADLLGITNITGSIEKGKTADIIAVDEDPIKNISILQNVTFVMKNGLIYKQ